MTCWIWTVSRSLPLAAWSDSNRWSRLNGIMSLVLRVFEEKIEVDGVKCEIDYQKFNV